MKARVLVLATLVLCSCDKFKKEQKTTLRSSACFKEISVIETFYEDFRGNPILLSNYEGKKVLLNFWATWCKPCIEEMPAMERAKDILEKENYVFLLASNEPINKIKAFQERNNFELDFIRYTGTLSQLKIYALPKTFIYNEDGKKVHEISGAAAWDSEKMIRKLKNIE